MLLLVAQGGDLVMAQGVTTLRWINEYECSINVESILSNNIITSFWVPYTNHLNLQWGVFTEVASDVEIKWDVNPFVIGSSPAMQLTIFPFTLIAWDGNKTIWFWARNNTQTQACILSYDIQLDQTPPSTSSPDTPTNMQQISTNDLQLTWDVATDIGVWFDEYQIYISRDLSFPPNDTYTFTTQDTWATLIVPLYLRGQQYRRVEARDLLGNTVMSNPWMFNYNPYTPTWWPGNPVPDTPTPPPTPVCGNSIVEGSESCDDGNVTNGDGCSSVCTNEPPTYCGDGDINQPSEQCDDGNIANGDGCTAQCQNEATPSCGDGALNQPSEQCDDGNATDEDGCDVFCMYEPIIVPTSVCGNNILENGEDCDDGNTSNADNCSTTCTTLYTIYCGNGIREGNEDCDDGNTDNGDSCTAQCQRERWAFCGDGMVNQRNELCDDGNWSEADPCGTNCQIGGPATCGNGSLDASEQCDDGNLTNGDGCSQRCTNENTRFANEDTFNTDIPDKQNDTTAWGDEDAGDEQEGTITKDISTTDSIKIGKKPTTQSAPHLITKKLLTVDEFTKQKLREKQQEFADDPLSPLSPLSFDTQNSEKKDKEHAAPFRATPHPRWGLTWGKSFTKITGMSILVFFALAYDVDTYRVRYRMILFKEPFMVATHLTYFRTRREEG
jgi:cysteine-rich repeat protein